MRAGIHELADYFEIKCRKNGRISEGEIISYHRFESDSASEEDTDDDTSIIDDIVYEFDRRNTACAGGYPFSLERDGTLLRFIAESPTHDPLRTIIYLFLLLCTRLNMKEKKVVNGVDGTFLMEELGAHVLRNYLGPERAKSIVFGTSQNRNFKERVRQLCKLLNDGGGFRSKTEASVQEKDGKLDAVAWVPFADNNPGTLVIFGQCKTGTSWKDELVQLQPESFIKKWMHNSLLVDPVRAFCIAEAPKPVGWENLCIDAGILFDRCRIVELSADLPDETFLKIKDWTLKSFTIIWPQQ